MPAAVFVPQAVLGIAPVGLPHLQVPQLDTGFAPDQNLELLMQQQGMSASTSTNALNRAASSNTSYGSSSQAAAGISGANVGDDQQQQAACGGDAPTSSSAMAQPSPKQQQLVSPTALPMPRMSNAFARKHGLDPKENPLVNLQRLAMQQQMPAQPGTMVRNFVSNGAVKQPQQHTAGQRCWGKNIVSGL
jgi:hypothetical protein